MRGFWKQQLWVVLAAAFVVSLNLGAARLWDEDEPKNATCAAEMLARGDWTVPTFNGELRTDKPILLYWCMLLSYHVFGVTELGARMTSALCGVGTALLTYHLGRRLFGAATGLWAGLLLCSSLMFVVAARGATPDSLLIFFSTLAIWFFVDGSTKADKRVLGATPQLNPLAGRQNWGDAPGTRSNSPIVGLPSYWRTYVLMYEAMAFAVLAKGPVGFLLPTAVIGLYLLVINPAAAATVIPTGQNNSRFGQIRTALAATVSWLWRTMSPPRIVRMAGAMRPLIGLAMLALVALPWYLLVGMETQGAWPLGFFWHHNLDRYVASLDGHQGVPLYHFFSIAAGFFPASVFLLPMVVHTVRRLKADDQARRGYVLAACWVA
ncbi:MAG: glycosyltransferase family 39 protein, partial [Planctomycetia bacterium]|nr:glycosyltransferase family 39 protein [Planctomycetia bacterium]